VEKIKSMVVIKWFEKSNFVMRKNHTCSLLLFGSRVLEGRGGEGGEIFNLKCLVQFLEGEGSKSF